MKKMIVFGLATLVIASCSDQPSKTDVAAANTNLSYAAIELAEGRPFNRAELVGLPGLEEALIERAERAKDSALAQLRDPTDVIWGDIWTPDLIMICGTANGRNAYGAYAGDEVFYAPNGTSARLPGHYQYEAKDLAKCWEGDHYRVIIPAEAPVA